MSAVIVFPLVTAPAAVNQSRLVRPGPARKARIRAVRPGPVLDGNSFAPAGSEDLVSQLSSGLGFVPAIFVQR